VGRFQLVEWMPGADPGPRAIFDIECSSGTYIRSLVEDLGRSLGLPAVTTFLLRRRVGPFGLAGAVTLEELAGVEPGREPPVMPLAQALGFLPAVAVDEAVARHIAHGRALPAAGLGIEEGAGPVRLLDRQGRLLAVASGSGGLLRYEAVFVVPGDLT